MKTAEIIIIGDEILDGKITDTNSVYISQELLKLGIKTMQKTVVGDDKKSIAAAVEQTLEREPNFLFLLGGIGVTPDDVTKMACAELFGRRIIVDDKALAHVEGVYKRALSEVEKIMQQFLMAPLPYTIQLELPAAYITRGVKQKFSFCLVCRESCEQCSRSLLIARFQAMCQSTPRNFIYMGLRASMSHSIAGLRSSGLRLALIRVRGQRSFF